MHFFYIECCHNRNQVYYEPNYQRKMLQKWCKELKKIEKIKRDFQINSFIIEHNINEENVSISYIKEWIRCVREMTWNKVKYGEEDLRKYLIKVEKARLIEENIENIE